MKCEYESGHCVGKPQFDAMFVNILTNHMFWRGICCSSCLEAMFWRSDHAGRGQLIPVKNEGDLVLYKSVGSLEMWRRHGPGKPLLADMVDLITEAEEELS